MSRQAGTRSGHVFWAAVALDLVSKGAAELLSRDVGLVRPRTNPELALGIMSLNDISLRVAVLFLGLGAIVWHSVRLCRRQELASVWTALLFAGVAANLIDRVVTGVVHDWLWLGPVIANLADFWILAGLVMYTAAAWRSADSPKPADDRDLIPQKA